MAAIPKNKKEVVELVHEQREAASGLRNELARRIGRDACYYGGIQLLQDGIPDGRAINTSLGTVRLEPNYSPDASSIRIVVNEIARHVHKVAASTRPNRIEIDATSRSSQVNVQGEALADAAETAVQAQIDECKLVQAARRANFCRTVTGHWVLALGVRHKTAAIDGQPMPDKVMYAFDADPTQLILDPAEKSKDLADHDRVIFEDVWTVRKIKATFPDMTIDADKLQTIGSLEPVKTAVGAMSKGLIYEDYVRNSNAKGARVYQIHFKDDTDRHGIVFYMIDLPGGPEVPNIDDPASPFGGTGMPFQMLYGHQRMDSIWGVSDTAMMRPNQDLLNLTETLRFRIQQKYAGSQWLVDRRAFENRPTDEQIREMMTNIPYGVNIYTGSDKQRAHNPPQLVTFPEPPQFIDKEVAARKEAIRENSHKSAGNFGPENLKSHVTEGAAGRAFDDAGEVADERIAADVEAIERLAGVMYGTTINCLRAQYPSTAAMLSVRGFGPDDFTALVNDDPNNPAVQFKVRESSVRYRSHRQRQQQVDFALANGALPPDEYRDIMAATLEMPLSNDDGVMAQAAAKAARNVMLGMPWPGKRLGRYGTTFINAFRRASVSKEAMADPNVAALFDQAILVQQQIMAEEMALMAPPTGAGEPGPEEPPMPELGPEASPADVLDQMAA